MTWMLKAAHWKIVTTWILLVSVAALAAEWLADDTSKYYSYVTVPFFLSSIGAYPFLLARALQNINGRITLDLSMITLVASATVLVPAEVNSVTENIADLVFVVSYIYICETAARSLRSLEVGERPGISRYLNEVFAIVNWPIGIWFIQPRANELYEKMQVSSTKSPSH